MITSLANLIHLAENKKLNTLKLKQNLQPLISGELSEEKFLKENLIIDYSQDDIFEMIQKIYDVEPSLQKMAKKRKDKAEKFLMGRLMALTKGKINSKDAFELIKRFFNNL